MDHLLELFHSEHDEDLLDVDLQIIQDWLVVAPPSIFYTVSTVLFHEHERVNVSVTNFMSHFNMFVPTKATVELANGNTGHAQGIEIILCQFPNCKILYPVGTVYYCPCQPSNTISSGELKFCIGLKNLYLKLLNILTLLTLKVVLRDHPTIIATILTIFNSKLSK